MTEVSKEAVEAFEKAMNLAFEYHFDPPYNAPISECVKVAMEMLGDSGFTIAPIAPVTDEKLREAVDLVKYYHSGNSVACDELSDAMQTIYATLTELTELRAAMTWQPIETAPKDGTKILLSKFGYHNDAGDEPVGTEEWSRRVWDNTRRKFSLWWCVAGHWSVQWNNWNDGVEPSGLAGPTHWMPLPTPPKED